MATTMIDRNEIFVVVSYFFALFSFFHFLFVCYVVCCCSCCCSPSSNVYYIESSSMQCAYIVLDQIAVHSQRTVFELVHISGESQNIAMESILHSPLQHDALLDRTKLQQMQPLLMGCMMDHFDFSNSMCYCSGPWKSSSI